MESISYAKTGEGVPPSPTECSYINARGARCHMLAGADSPLCPHHARQQVIDQRKRDTSIAKSLFSDLDDFTTPDCVLNFLGKLLREVAAGRVDRRDAATMTYICQLMLNTQSAFKRFNEADSEHAGSQVIAQLLEAQRKAAAAANQHGHD